MDVKLNQHLSIRLENNKSNIYINGRKTLVCSRLILSIPIADIKRFDGLNSIDEITSEYKVLTAEREKNCLSITPEEEFWGHCSNLQVWIEHDYDTRIIASNLGFPLLRKLTEAGDPKAKLQYKNEIVKRFCSGFLPVISVLVQNGHLDIFSEEELDILFESIDYNVLFSGLSEFSRYYSIPKVFSLLIKNYGRNTKKVFLNWILKHLERRDYDYVFSLLFNSNRSLTDRNKLKSIFELLDKDELHSVLNLMDLNVLDSSRRSRSILRELIKLGSEKARDRFVTIITDLLEKDEDFPTVAYSIIDGIFDEVRVNADVITQIFGNFDYIYYTNKYEDLMPLLLYHLAKYGIKSAQEYYMSKDFLISNDLVWNTTYSKKS